MKKFFSYQLPFQLESGITLSRLEIAYHTFGEMNADKSNVVWIFHALTANSDPTEWWSGLVGDKKVIDPSKHFIVCANIIGSCYGSSGPLSIDPKTNSPYYSHFPEISIRDMVNAHRLLKNYLGIGKIQFGLGGSMGGYQLLEWSSQEPELFNQLILLATAAKESAWGIAIHTTQRMAIETDPSWKDHNNNAGKAGLKTARGIGMLTYRNYESFVKNQTNPDHHQEEHKASTYIEYQGQKLANRFNAYSYWLLTKAMDGHSIGKSKSEIEEKLKSIHSKVLIIGISSDILCPVNEQEYLHEHLPNSHLAIIDSIYGHDGFLIEFEQVSSLILSQFKDQIRY